jgi:hypothetical protein
MCNGVCFVISRTGEIYNSEENISCHEAIITENNIHDGNMRNIVRIEMLPQGDLFSTKEEDWVCSVDEDNPPNWFTENYQELRDKCYSKLWLIISGWMVNNTIEGNLDLCFTQIKTLGKLEHVGYLDLYKTQIETLGDLKDVKWYLDIRHTKIKSLGELKSIGTNLYLNKNQIIDMKDCVVGGRIFTDSDESLDISNN